MTDPRCVLAIGHAFERTKVWYNFLDEVTKVSGRDVYEPWLDDVWVESFRKILREHGGYMVQNTFLFGKPEELTWFVLKFS
jgi:hypothetical protein